MAAAFINGLAVLLSVYHPPGLEQWAWAAFAFGLGCALLLGIYLLGVFCGPGETNSNCSG